MRQTQLIRNKTQVRKSTGRSFNTGINVNNKEVRFDEMLKESEIRYRRMFETAKDGILLLDFETGRIIDANPFIINIIDYPLKDILGKELWEIGLFSNKEQLKNAFTVLKTNGYIRFEDMPIQSQNGKISVEFTGNVFLVRNKKVIQFNIRDSAGLKNTEKAFKENEQYPKKRNTDYINLNKEFSALNEKLNVSREYIQNLNNKLIDAKNKAEGLDKLKSAFLTNINHEIRTPLNAIMGFSELLIRPGFSKEQLTRFVQLIKANSLQLLSVMNDIINISKIESGQLTIISEPVDINNLIKEIFTKYEKTVELKKLKLHYFCNCPNDLIQIKSDKNKISQVLCSLLENAIKFTKKGHINVGYYVKENFIEFYVEDTGIGIARENHTLIFQHFRQLDSTFVREYEGNGLGLSISKALVEKLGGAISVNSKPGKGSTFSFTLPYIKKTEKNFSSVYKINTVKSFKWNKKTVPAMGVEVKNPALIE